MTVAEVICEGFQVERAGSRGSKHLPGCKGAAAEGGGIESAEFLTLLLRLEIFLKHDEWLVAATLRTGDL